MPTESIDALRQQWQRLVIDHFEARRAGQRQRLSDEMLLQLDLIYGIKIDVAYSELKIAESLEVLRVTVKQKSVL